MGNALNCCDLRYPRRDAPALSCSSKPYAKGRPKVSKPFSMAAGGRHARDGSGDVFDRMDGTCKDWLDPRMARASATDPCWETG